MILVTVQIVLDGDVEKETHMAVGHAVEHLPPLSTGTNQTRQPKLSQLVARRRLTGLDGVGKVCHTEATTIEKRIDHAEPCRVGQQLEAPGQGHRRLDIEETIGRRAVSMRRDARLLTHVPGW